MPTLALIGDVMIGRGVAAVLKNMQPQDMWGDVLPHLLQADLRIANLECALTRHAQSWTRSWKTYHFRADPAAVRFLQAARIDACSLANNHVLDFEVRGLRDTLNALNAAGIHHAGAGLDLGEAAAPALIEMHGTTPCRVALLAFTDNQPDFAADARRPGTNYLEVSLDAGTQMRVAEAIGRARAQGADLVVFSNHWGANFVERPAPDFRDFARRVIELGADVYYGHSAHLCQGIEIHQGRPILYDTGDFIDDYAVDPVLRNDHSCLFKLMFDQRRLQRIELVPVKLDFAQVALAHGEDFAAIAARMEMLCAELGTTLERRANRLLYEPER
jgi:poly-gamma-glutamate capsule biosynthesis protein CapA/YwtB (metallophosphatase superfamily)